MFCLIQQNSMAARNQVWKLNNLTSVIHYPLGASANYSGIILF